MHAIYVCLDGGFGNSGGAQSLLEYSSKRTPQEIRTTGSMVLKVEGQGDRKTNYGMWGVTVQVTVCGLQAVSHGLNQRLCIGCGQKAVMLM